MEKINLNKKIFSLVKKQNFSELLEIIKDNIEKKSSLLNLDIIDENYNYLIQYLINFNQVKIINYILKYGDIRLDILDTDGRNLLYVPIKYNYYELLQIILKYDKNNIGVSIIDTRDNFGYTGLHYACIFNNTDAFKLLYKLDADVLLRDKEQNNTYLIALQYKRSNMIIYLLKKELEKNINNIKFVNTKGETLLQSALTYEDEKIVDYILDLKLDKEYYNNQDNDYGLTILHQSVVLKKNDINFKLIELGVNVNISDFLGNTSFHYGLIEKNMEYIKKLITLDELHYNVTNLNGDTPLHLYLDYSIINIDLFKSENRDKYDNVKIILKLIENTNINIQNNQGITPLHILVEKNLWKVEKVKNILKNGKTHMNLFISDNNGNNSISKLINNNDKDELIELTVESYYQILKKISKKEKLIINWEKYCALDDKDNLLKILKKKDGKETKIYCKEKIKDMIIKQKRSIPQYQELDLHIDSGLYKDGCYYTGSAIDILFGLVYLYQEHSEVGLILEYPLTENKELVNYYKKMGLNLTFKLDFSNIEITWTYQKLIYPTNFDSILINVIQKDNLFVVIPLGIEISEGSHANIIIIDKKNKKIERFEPNGKNYPHGLYYNNELLDEILITKFNQLLPQYKYYKPKQYLPNIGFQILETLEDEKCKKISDPNGFCAVWCVWWAHQKIKNKKISSKILAKELINRIKLENKNFKNIIRNFSQKIVNIRDTHLQKYNITIDDWVMNNDKAD